MAKYESPAGYIEKMRITAKLVELQDFLLSLNDSEKEIFGTIVRRMATLAVGTNKREELEARLKDADEADLALIKSTRAPRST